jgi:thiamine-phosphate pyrophosphorylase
VARLSTVPRLYAIADEAALAPVGLVDAVARLAATGVRWIQLRAKDLADDRFLAEAEAAAAIAVDRGARLWINDRLDVAKLSGAAGLHLGQRDLEASDARRLLGNDVAIGVSTHDRGEFERAANDPAIDVIAIGPIFPTASKLDASPVVGLELLAWARLVTTKPLVAIGGINTANAASVLAAGADSVAVLGALENACLEESARALLAAVGR